MGNCDGDDYEDVKDDDDDDVEDGDDKDKKIFRMVETGPVWWFSLEGQPTTKLTAGRAEKVSKSQWLWW